MSRRHQSRSTAPPLAAEDNEVRSAGVPSGLSRLLSAAAAADADSITTFGDRNLYSDEDAEGEDGDDAEAEDCDIENPEDDDDDAEEREGDEDEVYDADEREDEDEESYTSMIGRQHKSNWSDSELEEDYNTHSHDLSSAPPPKAPKKSVLKNLPRCKKEPKTGSKASKKNLNSVLTWGKENAAVADELRKEITSKDEQFSSYSRRVADIIKARDKSQKQTLAELKKAKAQSLRLKEKAQDLKLENQSMKKQLTRLERQVTEKDIKLEKIGERNRKEVQALKTKVAKVESAAAKAKSDLKKKQPAQGAVAAMEGSKVAVLQEKHRLDQRAKDAEHRRKMELEDSRRDTKRARYAYAHGMGNGPYGCSDFRNMAPMSCHPGPGPMSRMGMGYGYEGVPGHYGRPGFYQDFECGQGYPPRVTPRGRDGPPIGISFSDGMDGQLSQLTTENIDPNDDATSCAAKMAGKSDDASSCAAKMSGESLANIQIDSTN